MPIKKLPLINYRLLIKSGSSLDPSDKKGCSLLLAEILNKGSGDDNAIEFLEKVENLGGVLQANATKDYSIINGSFLQPMYQKGFSLLSQMLLFPKFNKSEFQRIKHRLLSSIKGITDNPSALSTIFYHKIFFNEKHPYGSPVHGKINTVNNITIEDIKKYYTRNYKPDNAILTVVGDFNINMMVKTIESHLLKWTSPYNESIIKPKLKVKKGVNFYIINKPESIQTQIKMGSSGIKSGDKSYFPLMVANTIFGGSFTSRLVQSVRAKHGLTYSINSGFTTLKHQGPFTISTFTKNETVGKTIKIIFQLIHKIQEKGVNSDEINKAKKYLTGTYPLSIETNDSLSAQLTNIAFYELSRSWVSDYIPNILDLNEEIINTSISNHFPDNDIVIVLLTNAKKVISQLDKLGSVQIIEQDTF